MGNNREEIYEAHMSRMMEKYKKYLDEQVRVAKEERVNKKAIVCKGMEDVMGSRSYESLGDYLRVIKGFEVGAVVDRNYVGDGGSNGANVRKGCDDVDEAHGALVG
eukprot:CAMPEP_0118661680 /NCGR_PEP_ID=MMETSP0785-20121206/16421_1 /TAXON_ID=91992 /ORGANISM="Bolidomonas pacifica, Strain CCMP 1866" /LENGTH=105 /DNA_ID=CAMNT_0006555161 /DNA_START=8 /DNA_END=321 /DNA_ORIENTATION=+